MALCRRATPLRISQEARKVVVNLAIIPPRSMVNVSSYGSWAFCLGQEAIRDSQYREYFCHCPLPVILDNGAFENDLPSIRDYFTLARLIRPRIVILPDVLNDASMTDELHRRSVGELFQFEDGSRPTCLAVPQGRTIEESLVLANRWAVQGLPVQGIALSFKGLGQEPEGFTRARFIVGAKQIGLLESYLFQYVHLLGHENEWQETEALATTAATIRLVIHSLDTAEPVRHALADHKGEPELLNNGWLVDRPRERGYLELPPETEWSFHQRLKQYASCFTERLTGLFG